MMSSCDTITITVTGKGTHGSMPQEGVDALNVGVHIYSALQNLTARELAPEEQGVLTIGSFNGGEAANVLPEKVCLVGTMRTTVEATRTRFKSASRPSAREWHRRLAPRWGWSSRRAFPLCTMTPR